MPWEYTVLIGNSSCPPAAFQMKACKYFPQNVIALNNSVLHWYTSYLSYVIVTIVLLSIFKTNLNKCISTLKWAEERLQQNSQDNTSESVVEQIWFLDLFLYCRKQNCSTQNTSSKFCLATACVWVDILITLLQVYRDKPLSLQSFRYLTRGMDCHIQGFWSAFPNFRSYPW